MQKVKKAKKWVRKMRKKNRKIAKFRNADFDRYLLKQRQSNRDFGKTEQKCGSGKNGKFRNFSFFRNADFDRYLLKQRQSNRDFGKTEQKVGLRKNAKKVKNMRSGKPEFFSFCNF